MKTQYFEIMKSVDGESTFVSGPIIGDVYELKDGGLIQAVNGVIKAKLKQGEWALRLEQVVDNPNTRAGGSGGACNFDPTTGHFKA